MFGFKSPSKNATTSLLLVGKIIQVLANGKTHFKDQNLAFLGISIFFFFPFLNY